MLRLQKLPDNWDSYGGMALKNGGRGAALRFLRSVMNDHLPLPDIVPLADGGVQLAWRPKGVEIDFVSDDELSEPTLSISRDSMVEELKNREAVTYFLEELGPILTSPKAG